MAMRGSSQLGFSDVIAFLMIAAFSYKSTEICHVSGLFGRVVRDATVYFLMIVWVHLTVTIYTSRMGDVSPPSPSRSRTASDRRVEI